MKKCPHCGREYDSTMSFCLDDGAELLYGPSTPLLPEKEKVRDDGLTRMKLDFFMDNIRSDPRFADLMKRVGLP